MSIVTNIKIISVLYVFINAIILFTNIFVSIYSNSSSFQNTSPSIARNNRFQKSSKLDQSVSRILMKILYENHPILSQARCNLNNLVINYKTWNRYSETFNYKNLNSCNSHSIIIKMVSRIVFVCSIKTFDNKMSSNML